MNTSKILTFIILFLFNTCLWSGPDSSKYKIKKTYFKIGINTNYLFNSTEIKSGFTGLGLLCELHFRPQISLVGLFNTLKIEEKKEGEFSYLPDISNYEVNFKLRYRKIMNRFSIFIKWDIIVKGI